MGTNTSGVTVVIMSVQPLRTVCLIHMCSLLNHSIKV